MGTSQEGLVFDDLEGMNTMEGIIKLFFKKRKEQRREEEASEHGQSGGAEFGSFVMDQNDQLSFDQKTGTDGGNIVDRKLVCFDSFQDIAQKPEAGAWILAIVTGRVTKKTEAARSNYKNNWHNIKVLGVLYNIGAWDVPVEVYTFGRCVNLTPGGMWTVVTEDQLEYWKSEEMKISFDQYNPPGGEFISQTCGFQKNNQVEDLHTGNAENGGDEDDVLLEDLGSDRLASTEELLMGVGRAADFTLEGDGEEDGPGGGEGSHHSGGVGFVQLLPTYCGPDETMDQLSNITGWTDCTAKSFSDFQNLIPLDWAHTHGNILSIVVLAEDWLRLADGNRGVTGLNAMSAIKGIKMARDDAISTLQHLFVCGLLSDGAGGVDEASAAAAHRFYGNQPAPKYVGAMKAAARRAKMLSTQLERMLATDQEDDEDGIPCGSYLINTWLGTQEGANSPNEYVYLDIVFISQCMKLFKERCALEKAAQAAMALTAGSSRTATRTPGMVRVSLPDAMPAQKAVMGEKLQGPPGIYIDMGRRKGLDDSGKLEDNRSQGHQQQKLPQSKMNEIKQWERSVVRPGPSVALNQTAEGYQGHARLSQQVDDKAGVCQGQSVVVDSRQPALLSGGGGAINQHTGILGGCKGAQATVALHGLKLHKSVRVEQRAEHGLRELMATGAEGGRNDVPDKSNTRVGMANTGAADDQPGQWVTISQRERSLLEEISCGVASEHKWIFQKEPAQWRKHLSGEGYAWTPKSDLHPSMAYLLCAHQTPVWAAGQMVARELADIQLAFEILGNASEEMDRFLQVRPETEDEIKGLLRSLDSNQHKQLDKLQAAVASLVRDCTKSVNLPVMLTSAIKHRAKLVGAKSDEYIAKVKEIREAKEAQGILLFPTNQSLQQTEDQIRIFTGNNHITYPEWKVETLAVLARSGIKKDNWVPLILKKISTPAKNKVSQETLASKLLHRVWADLELFFADSYTIVSTLSQLHDKIGVIADPDVNMQLCHNALKRHKEVLAGMGGFLRHSANEDRFAAVYNLHVCKSRIILLPEKVRRGNALFIRLTDSSLDTNTRRYKQFEEWVTTTLESVLYMNADAAPVASHHPVLATQPSTTQAGEESAVRLLAEQVKVLTDQVQRMDINGRHPGSTGQSQRREHGGGGWDNRGASNREVQTATHCRYCTAVMASRHSADKAANAIQQMGFREIHDIWVDGNSNRERVSAQGCLQWVSLTVIQRREVIHGMSQKTFCSICLAQPDKWNSIGTKCAGRHAIRRPSNRPWPGQICMKEECENHFTICKEHMKDNQAHPKLENARQWMDGRMLKPKLSGLGLTNDIVMLLPELVVNQTIEGDVVSQGSSEEFHDIHVAGHCTVASGPEGHSAIFEAEAVEHKEEGLSTMEVLATKVPSELGDRLAEAVMMVTNGQNGLPPCVTTDWDGFLATNQSNDTHLVEQREGDAVLIYLDLYGNNNRSIRVVFDGGATVCLWIQDTIFSGKINAYVDPKSSRSLEGVGGGITTAMAGTVILPGNTKKEGRWHDFYACSSFVPQIIQDVRVRGTSDIVAEVLSGASKHNTLPKDMVVSNFQQVIGGRIEGLIGIKHADMFPEEVMTLTNGMIVYRHKLRPAGSRDRVYAIGGTVNALEAYRGMVGSDFQSIMLTQVHEALTCKGILMDGDFTDRTVRGIASNPDVREQLGEAECRTMQSNLAATLALSGADTCQTDFRVIASNPKPP